VALTTTYTEGDAPLAIATFDSTITDEDSHLGSVVVSISNVQDVGKETLTVTGGDAVNWSGITGLTVAGSGTTTVTISGDIAPSYYQLALRSIKYANSSGSPSEVQRDITVVATDMDAHVGNTGHTYINVVSVPNAPTVANAIDDQTSTGAGVKTFQFATNVFTDNDGDTLSYTASLADDTALPSWLSFDSTTRTFSGNPPHGAGPLTVKVTALDGTSNAGVPRSVSDTFTWTFNTPNDTPTLANPSLLVNQTHTGPGNITPYAFVAADFVDTDPGETFTYSAGVWDGHTLSALPAWLTFTASTRTFSGNPPAGTTSPLTLRITATDSGGVSLTDDFTLTLSGNLNDISPLPDPAQGVITSVEAALSDFTVTDEVNSTQIFAVTLTPSNGSLNGLTDLDANIPGIQLSGTATELNAAIAEATFTGTAAGAASIAIAVTDSATLPNVTNATYNLSVSNEVTPTAPTVAHAIADQTSTGAGTKTFQFAADVFADSNGDTLTYAATLDDDTALPSWLSFDSTTRTFSGNPPHGAGPLSVKVTALDGTNNAGVPRSVSDTFSWTFTTPNDTPTLANALTDQMHTGAGSITPYTFEANSFADADAGETFTYNAGLWDAGTTTLSTLPTWLSFNATNRTFSGNPPAGTASPLTLRITTTDSGGATVTDDFTLTLNGNLNDAPTIADVPTTILGPLWIGLPAMLADFSVADADTEILSVTLVGANGSIGGLTDADLSTPGTQLTGTSSSLNPALAAATFTPTAAGAASITISVSDAIVSSPTVAVYAINAISNRAPTGTVTISGSARQGQTLTASHNLSDSDGPNTVTNVIYQWFADGASVGSGSSLSLTQGMVGARIHVEASYTDNKGTPERVSSSSTGSVANVNDAPSGTVTITGTAAQGRTLTASNDLTDADGMGTVSYQWFANGEPITNAMGTSLTLEKAQSGKVITVQASYTDGFGAFTTVSSVGTAVVANINEVPTGGITISGSPIQGQTLNASNDLADGDGLGAITYQWHANGMPISGAVGISFTLGQDQVGKTITAVGHYIDGQGLLESVSSAPTAPVGNSNDAPSGSVTISGTTTLGQTLTASHTLADADGPTTLAVSYQWFAGNVAIAGATANTLLLTPAQIGQSISVQAIYTDTFGQAERVSSAATSAVDDSDGITNEEEDQTPGLPTEDGQPPVPGDGNGDGIADSQQPDVTSVGFLETPTAVSNPANAPATFVSLVADSAEGKTDTTDDNSATLNNVRQLDAPDDLPANVQMPLGRIAFESSVGFSGTPDVGITETFSLYVDAKTLADGSFWVNGYWKQDGDDNWVNLASSIAQEGQRLRIDFSITDGGEFDEDGVVNGTIVDPGAPAFRQAHAATLQEQLISLYVAYYDRAPDLEGLNYWLGGVAAGDSLSLISANFAAHPRFMQEYGDLTNQQIAQKLYQNMLHHEGDTDGIRYWAEQLGSKPVSDVVLNFITAALNVDLSAALGAGSLALADYTLAYQRQNVVYNLLAASQQFLDTFGNQTVPTAEPNNLSQDAAYQAAVSVLNAIDSDLNAVYAQSAQLASLIGQPDAMAQVVAWLA